MYERSRAYQIKRGKHTCIHVHVCMHVRVRSSSAIAAGRNARWAALARNIAMRRTQVKYTVVSCIFSACNSLQTTQQRKRTTLTAEGHGYAVTKQKHDRNTCAEAAALKLPKPPGPGPNVWAKTCSRHDMTHACETSCCNSINRTQWIC